MKNLRWFSVAVVLIVIGLSTGIAQWTNNPATNNVVAPFVDYPTLVTDGNNGVIVFGEARLYLLRAQRLGVDGRLLWPGIQGVKVSDALHEQYFSDIDRDFRFVLPDGRGGAFIAFQVGKIIGRYEEPPEPKLVFSVYLQRLEASGSRLFGAEGLKLMPVQPDTHIFAQKMTGMIADGFGGVYVIWYYLDSMNRNKDGVYLARVNQDGQMLWGPKRLSIDFNTSYLPYRDNSDKLSLYELAPEANPPIKDHFLKLEAATGNLLIQKEIEIGVGESGFNPFYRYCQGDDGSAIFAFYDFRAETLRVQKLDGDGNKLWGKDPIKITKDLLYRLSFDIKSNKKDGAYLWYMSQDTVSHFVYLGGQGQILWQKDFLPSGRFFGPFPPEKPPMTVSPDGSLFVIRDDFQRIFKITEGRQILWQTQISTRVSQAFANDGYDLLADSAGSCIVVWQEITNDYVGLRGQRVDRYGNLGGSTPVQDFAQITIPHKLQLENVMPNPFTQSVAIHFAVPRNESISLKVYDLLGKEVSTLKNDTLAPGSYSLIWEGRSDDGKALASGLYFIILRNDQELVTRKLMFLK